MTIRKIQTARKPHVCTYGNDTIEVGERYVDEVYPPWTLIQEDHEYPPTKQDTWEHITYHATCFNRTIEGIC